MVTTYPAVRQTAGSTRALRTSQAQPVEAPSEVRNVFIISTLLVACTVSWRQNTFYQGGVDPVVAAKALLNLAALVLAFRLRNGALSRRQIRWFPIPMLIAFGVLSALGGFGYGDGVASAVLSVRLAMAAAVIVLVAQYVEPAAVAQSLSRAMEMVAFLAGATGLKYVAQGERLRGGIPALAPNEIAFLCVIPILFVVWNALQGRGHRRDLVEVAALVSLIWLSQSRTSLVVLVVSVAIMLTQNRRLPVGVFMLLLVALPIITYVLFGTHLLGGFLGRGGTQDITTLDSRTVAWQTALSLPGDIWQQAFGGGLALTQIPVQALYRTVQDLDSSWISALVQGGVVGVGILAYWTASTVLSVRRSEAPQRTLWLGLITFVILRSFLESGLLEATPAFLLFILMGVSTGQSGAADPESVSAMELVPRRTAPLFLETTGPSQ